MNILKSEPNSEQWYRSMEQFSTEIQPNSLARAILIQNFSLLTLKYVISNLAVGRTVALKLIFRLVKEIPI